MADDSGDLVSISSEYRIMLIAPCFRDSPSETISGAGVEFLMDLIENERNRNRIQNSFPIMAIDDADSL